MIPNTLGDGIVRPPAKTMPARTRCAFLRWFNILPKIRWTLAIHKYGDLRVREYFDRLAAEDNRRDPATPV